MEHRLYRSKHNRVLLGVCGGIAEYFQIDPVIIRIIAVLLIIPGVFPAIIAYFVLALIIPVEGSASSSPRDNIRENVNEIRDTGIGIGEEIRSTFKSSETKTEGPGQPVPVTPPQPRPDSNRALWVLGLIIVIIGLFFLLINVFGWFWRFLWPIVLIAVGLIIIALVVRRK
jgi:phage shock protein C